MSGAGSGGGGGGKGRSVKGGGGGTSPSLSPSQQAQVDNIAERFKSTPKETLSRQMNKATDDLNKKISLSEQSIRDSQENIKIGDRLLNRTGTSVAKERANIAQQQKDIAAAKERLAITNAVKKKMGL